MFFTLTVTDNFIHIHIYTFIYIYLLFIHCDWHSYTDIWGWCSLSSNFGKVCDGPGQWSTAGSMLSMWLPRQGHEETASAWLILFGTQLWNPTTCCEETQTTWRHKCRNFGPFPNWCFSWQPPPTLRQMSKQVADDSSHQSLNLPTEAPRHHDAETSQPCCPEWIPLNVIHEHQKLLSFTTKSRIIYSSTLVTIGTLSYMLVRTDLL